MFGTINPSATGYLKDNTGSRRFWTFAVGEIDLERIRRDRDQFWAEAVHRYLAGEANWLPPSIAEQAEAAANERREEVPWADPLRQKTFGLTEITAAEAMEKLGVAPERQNRATQMQIAEALKEIGFRSGSKQKNEARKWIR
jgi:predicted P-loop ATPase